MNLSSDWQISVTSSAEKSLRRLAKDDRAAVVSAIDRLPNGDTRKLQGRENEFRLRIGGLRVVFYLDRGARAIEIREVFHRSRGY